ncbi:MAG: hypothetical protein ABI758_05020 [Candidatus Woesebacteria bacterium]
MTRIRPITYFKEKPLRLLIAGLILLAIIAFFLRVFTPAQQTLSSIPVPTIPTLRQTSLQDAQVSIDLSKIPVVSTYDVFQATPVHLTLEALGPKLGLQATSFKNTWQDTTKRKALVFDPYSKRFNYSNTLVSGDFDAATVQKLQTDTAISIANTFVKQTLGATGLLAKKDDMEFFTKTDSHPEEATAETGNLALIPFTYEKNGFTFYSDSDSQPPVVVFVDSGDQVTGFTASEYFFSVGSSSKVQALQAESVSGEIKAGNFSILKIATDDPSGFDLKNVEQLIATSVTVEYRFSSSSNTVIPYYNIDAEVKLASLPAPIQLTLITPAVKTSVENN